MIERLLFAVGLLLALWAGWCLIACVQRRLARPRAADLEGPWTLLYFYTPTCGPCRLVQAPILESLAAEWKEAVRVRPVDVTADPEAAARYRVWTVPTTMWVDASGTIRMVNNGVATAEALRQQWLRLQRGKRIRAAELPRLP
ncbi:thioredoxin family protein [Thermoflexus sp.]|uniref:thioredoxin family protein n=1 Tax=Thermoflexus sp. TaxID=1969742 RepID=UPI0035E409E1